MQNKNKNSKDRKIAIEAQLPIALEELAIYVLPKEKDTSKIFEVLNTNPMTPNYVMRKIARGILRKKKAEVKLKDIEHDYNDSQNMTHGVAYFRVELEGTEKELRRIAGEGKLFEFDWQSHNDNHTSATQ